MKILFCCPKCGCEDLDFLTPTTSTVIKCLNKICNNTFNINESGCNTKNTSKIVLYSKVRNKVVI